MTRHQSEKLDLKASYYGARVEANPGIGAFRQSALLGISWEATDRSRLDLKAGFQSMAYDGSRAAGERQRRILISSGIGRPPEKPLRLLAGYQTDFSEYVAYQVNKTISGGAPRPRPSRESDWKCAARWVLLDQQSVLENTSNGGELQDWSAGWGGLARATPHRFQSQL